MSTIRVLPTKQNCTVTNSIYISGQVTIDVAPDKDFALLMYKPSNKSFVFYHDKVYTGCQQVNKYLFHNC